MSGSDLGKRMRRCWRSVLRRAVLAAALLVVSLAAVSTAAGASPAPESAVTAPAADTPSATQPTTGPSIETASAPTASGLYGDKALSHWWLPKNYSSHGHEMDTLFLAIFWTTMIVFIGVEVALVFFLIKYRRRPGRKKALFTHGNTRLEMAWTLAPAVILLVLSLASKRVWDDFRYARWSDDPSRAQILVVGEQFKWNVVYPGPDRQLGRYLVFPKPTDARYRDKPTARALQEIALHIQTENPLGQSVNSDKNVPDAGRDDDYTKVPGRPIIVPADTPLDIHLSAKDVLHSFFLPNFRVKLDSVPGMRGHVYFIARQRSTRTFPIEEAPADKPIWIDWSTSLTQVEVGGNPSRFRIPDPTDRRRRGRRILLDSLDTLSNAARNQLRRERKPADDPALLADQIQVLRNQLRDAGITHLSVVVQPFELVCEELCGLGHYTMRNDFLVVSPQEYEYFLLKDDKTARPTPPSTPTPNVASAEAGQSRAEAN